MGFIVEEGDFTYGELLDAQGAFITNSIMGIMKVSKVDNKVLNQSTVVSEIERYYDRYVQEYNG
jgi:4-amino-4-deoxychorismate lyase